MGNKKRAPRLRRCRGLFIWIACVTVLSQTTGTAVAGIDDIDVVASHRVLAVTGEADGSYSVTFTVTLENRGATGLADVTLHLRSGYFREVGPERAPVNVDYLGAGSATAVEWTISSYDWVSEEPDYRPMYFDVEAVDDFAASVSFPVVSEEEAGQ